MKSSNPLTTPLITMSLLTAMVLGPSLTTTQAITANEKRRAGMNLGQPVTTDQPDTALIQQARSPDVNLETQYGLHIATFNTLQGTVTVNLPDDLQAGDTISGSVVAEPKGESEAERAENRSELNDYVVQIDKEQVAGDKQYAKLLVPAVATALPLILRNRQGREVARTEVPVQLKSATSGLKKETERATAPSAGYQTPSVGQSGMPIEVKGLFDGDLKTSGINIASRAVRVLAESPRKVVAQSPGDVTGKAEIEVIEQGKMVARCNYHSLAVRLSAEKLNLTRGEQTRLNLTLVGVEGIESPLTIRVINKTPWVIQMEGGQTQQFSVNPDQVQGDGYSTTRVLTGIEPGGFSITAIVKAAGDYLDKCAQPQTKPDPFLPVPGPDGQGASGGVTRPEGGARGNLGEGAERTAPPLYRNGGDIWIIGTEFTQAIQTYTPGDPSSSNQIPLIGYKPTVVRVYVQSREDRFGSWNDVTARLTVRNISSPPGTVIPVRSLSPINGRNGVISATTTGSNRNSTDDSFMFLLDYDATAPGEREFEVEISTISNRAESDRSNNRLTQRKQFSRQVYVSIYGYTYANLNSGSGCRTLMGNCPSTTPDGYRPPFKDFEEHRRYWENVFPVSQVWVEPIPGYDSRVAFDNSNCDAYINAHIWLAGEIDRLISSGAGRAMLLQPENGGYCGWCCFGTGGNQVARAQNFRGVAGPTFAHELAHSWGRAHTPDLSDGDRNFPRSDGSVGNQTGVKFSSSQIEIIPPQTPTGRRLGDLMSYNAPFWISPYTYCGLISAIFGGRLTCPSAATVAQMIEVPGDVITNARPGILSPTSLQDNLIASLGPPDSSLFQDRSQRQFLFVAGQIGVNGSAEFEPFEMINTPEDISSKSQGGSYSLSLEAKDGRMLSEYRFDPPPNRDSNQKAPARFSMFIHYVPTASRIVLTRGERVLAERIVSPNRPEIKLRPIKPMGSWTGKHVFSWEARDIDGDALNFSAYYSTDGGNRWIPLDAGFKEPRLEVNFDSLPGSDDARIRVVASDGVNTTEARPDVIFRVPRKKPKVAISAPVQTADGQQTPAVLIEATAYDWEDGAITDGTSYIWRSDRDGFIGMGTWLAVSNLSAGKHDITLTVTDSDKNITTSSVSVIVAEKSRRLDNTSGPLPRPDVDPRRKNSPSPSNVVPIDRPRINSPASITESPVRRESLRVDRGGSTVISGGTHSLIVMPDASVFAWGNNSSVQLGVPPASDSRIPSEVDIAPRVLSVVAGSRHSLALKTDGTVWGWGDNSLGQLGIAVYTPPSTRPGPRQITALNTIPSPIISISAAQDDSFAVTRDGRLWAWGYNTFEQLGFVGRSNEPRQVPGVSNVVAVVAGAEHTIILLQDGSVWAAGSNTGGELGDVSVGYSGRRSSFAPVPGISDVVAISAGAHFNLALKSDGTVWAWGQDRCGELGNRSGHIGRGPAQIQGLINITAIAAGNSHCLALRSDGTVWAWGCNDFGQLGNGTTDRTDVPARVAELSNIISINAGTNHSLAAATDGTVWAWGSNQFSQLGDGTVFDQRRPVRVRLPR